MKDYIYVISMMFLCLLRGDWKDLENICVWFIQGELTIEEVEIEVVPEEEFLMRTY